MRIGLYGMPTAGKSYIMNSIHQLRVFSGSSVLYEISPDFHSLSERDKNTVREKLAIALMKRDNFIMDGHFSFGENIVFTEADGELYDVFLYLYINPDILISRMKNSQRNSKYLEYDIDSWQTKEISELRNYCHKHNKDFYILDNPEKGYFSDINIVLNFIDNIISGFSCRKAAENIANEILKKSSSNTIILSDGDKTLISEDSSGFLGYTTHLFDNNFYTGFQSWKHNNEMTDFISSLDFSYISIEKLKIHYNIELINKMQKNSFILTSGYYGIWKQISERLNIPFFYGNYMSADTKFFITKILREHGKRIIAYGDGMNDYFMLREADEGYLILKPGGTISHSLEGKELEGIIFV
ncbi:MAG: AAA family ATPase [Ruminococcus flavefaciens]|nr:AAA family ATPase [Ruminococcus flavefaciens]